MKKILLNKMQVKNLKVLGKDVRRDSNPFLLPVRLQVDSCLRVGHLKAWLPFYGCEGRDWTMVTRVVQTAEWT